jgi:hypothetical protein
MLSSSYSLVGEERPRDLDGEVSTGKSGKWQWERRHRAHQWTPAGVDACRRAGIGTKANGISGSLAVSDRPSGIAKQHIRLATGDAISMKGTEVRGAFRKGAIPMFTKQIIATALLAVISTSGAAFAAQPVNDSATYAARHQHHVMTPDSRAAATERFFNGNPPEGWPYTND